MTAVSPYLLAMRGGPAFANLCHVESSAEPRRVVSQSRRRFESQVMLRFLVTDAEEFPSVRNVHCANETSDVWFRRSPQLSQYAHMPWVDASGETVLHIHSREIRRKEGKHFQHGTTYPI